MQKCIKYIISLIILGFLCLSRPTISNSLDQIKLEANTWSTTFGQVLNSQGPILRGATVRDVVPITSGGTGFKFSFLNNTSSPITIGEATVGIQLGGPSIAGGQVIPITFNSSQSITLAPNQSVTSDEISFSASALSTILVSIYLPGNSLPPVNNVSQSQVRSYLTPDYAGNAAGDVTGNPFSLTATNSYLISQVDVLNGARTIAVFGDDISSSSSLGNTWPALLAKRLLGASATGSFSVVNLSVPGMALTEPSQYISESGLSLVESEVPKINGLKYIILELGDNDIEYGANYSQIISAFKSLNEFLRAFHPAEIVFLLAPRDVSQVWQPVDNIEKNKINNWLNTGGVFSSVFNLSDLLANVYGGSCDPNTLYPNFNAGNGLGLTESAEVTIANYLPASMFGSPRLALIQPSVALKPTKDCSYSLRAPNTYNSVMPTSNKPRGPKPFQITAWESSLIVLVLISVLYFFLLRIRRKRQEQQRKAFYRHQRSVKRFKR